MLQDQTFGSRPILEVVAERYFFYFSLTKTTEWNELLGTNECKKSKDYHAVKADSRRFAFRPSGNFFGNHEGVYVVGQI